MELSLDEAAVSFTRRVPAVLSSAETLRQYLGIYRTPNGGRFDKEFADVAFEFVLVDGKVTELKQSAPSGEYRFTRQ